MVDIEVQTGRKDRPPVSGGWGCLMSILQILAFMALVAVVIWALNPGMSPEEAARGGVLWGGGILVSFCAIPSLIVLAAIGFVLALVLFRGWRRRRSRRPTVIDIR